ncbi:hypothetical protein Q5P01_000816 [Channa striata]|uniref:Immunoglobulin V-set domain-containing protein n=1 Tax=Channa striata TaxID=64152 RepID=A0AA88IGD1_CHASR|nr:hypothetical protein Q5P01_000816 [Channa striata]
MAWTRRDLKSGDYVFFYRDGNSHNSFQHPSFRGRAELRDPEMKDGDVSVILKNVTINDTGTYECWIIVGHSGSSEPAAPRLTNNTDLTVVDSGGGAGHTEGGGDKGGGAGHTEEGGITDEERKDKENKDVNVGLVVGLLVVGVLLSFVAFMIIRNCTYVKETFYKQVPQREGGQSKE